MVSAALERIQSNWITASTVGISLFALCVFWYPKGYILSSSILLLMSLVAGYYKQLSWHKNLTLLAMAIVIFIVPHLISLIQGTADLSDIKKAARGIPLLLVGAFLLRNKPKQECVYIAFALGLIISFIVMLTEQVSGFIREDYASFNINPLMMAIVAVFAFILPKTNTKNIWISALMYTAVTLTVATVMMSQSKGPTLSLFTVLIAFSIFSFTKANSLLTQSKKYIFVLWLLVLSSATITSVLSNGTLTARISVAQKNIMTHIAEPNSESEMSSSGIRLELWKGALILATEKPILGYGKLAARTRMLELIDEGRISAPAKDASQQHFHSIYFQALGNRGIFGLLTVLLLLIIPGYILLKNKNTEPVFAVSGLLVIINYIVTGAVDAALTSTLASITYFMLITLCISQVSVNNASVTIQQKST